MRADNSHHIVQAARRRSADTLERAEAALHRLAAADQPVTIARLAAEAGVSRSWLYAQPDLREQIAQHQGASTSASASARPEPSQDDRATAASLLHRLELAHQRIRQLTEENRKLRDQLAHLHGQQRTERHTGPPSKRRASRLIGPCN